MLLACSLRRVDVDEIWGRASKTKEDCCSRARSNDIDTSVYFYTAFFLARMSLSFCFL